MWLLLLIGSVDHEHTYRDRVAIIELNHLYDEKTDKLRFVQMIFWESKPFSKKRWHVMDWEMWGKGDPLPRYSYRDRRWQLYWKDEKRWRFIEATSYRVSHTYYDPEVDDQKVWPVEHRRGLSEHVQLHRAIPKLLDYLVRAHIRLKHVQPNSICGRRFSRRLHSQTLIDLNRSVGKLLDDQLIIVEIEPVNSNCVCHQSNSPSVRALAATPPALGGAV